MGRNINRTIYTVQNLHIYDKGHRKVSRIFKTDGIKRHNDVFKLQVAAAPARSSRENKRSLKRQ